MGAKLEHESRLREDFARVVEGVNLKLDESSSPTPFGAAGVAAYLSAPPPSQESSQQDYMGDIKELVRQWTLLTENFDPDRCAKLLAASYFCYFPESDRLRFEQARGAPSQEEFQEKFGGIKQGLEEHLTIVPMAYRLIDQESYPSLATVVSKGEIGWAAVVSSMKDAGTWRFKLITRGVASAQITSADRSEIVELIEEWIKICMLDLSKKKENIEDMFNNFFIDGQETKNSWCIQPYGDILLGGSVTGFYLQKDTNPYLTFKRLFPYDELQQRDPELDHDSIDMTLVSSRPRTAAVTFLVRENGMNNRRATLQNTAFLVQSADSGGLKWRINLMQIRIVNL